jgi:hypothetical protein
MIASSQLEKFMRYPFKETFEILDGQKAQCVFSYDGETVDWEVLSIDGDSSTKTICEAMERLSGNLTEIYSLEAQMIALCVEEAEHDEYNKGADHG